MHTYTPYYSIILSKNAKNFYIWKLFYLLEKI